MRDFALPSAAGKQTQLSDYRGRANLVAAWRAALGEAVPGAQEIVSWLEFIKRQCPECFPPEWPRK